MVSHRKALPAEFSWLPVRILQDSLHFDECNHNSVVISQHIYKHLILGYSAPTHMSTELIIEAEEEKQVWFMTEGSTLDGSDSSLDQAPKRNELMLFDSSNSDMEFSTCLHRRGVRRTFLGYVVPARSLSRLTSGRKLRLSKIPSSEGLPATSYRDDSAIVLDNEEIVNGIETFVKLTAYDVESIVGVGEDPSDEGYLYDGSEEEEINT
ncbi:hypothetical protein V1508DRAFT_453136 [Lipomyces doorenjongii]|uniref:uncharacterized protein n=1 Tax=Lipomyces doorenjongii TaxID=383834 RepID=UPI0034CD3D42